MSRLAYSDASGITCCALGNGTSVPVSLPRGLIAEAPDNPVDEGDWDLINNFSTCGWLGPELGVLCHKLCGASNKPNTPDPHSMVEILRLAGADHASDIPAENLGIEANPDLAHEGSELITWRMKGGCQ